VLRDPGDIIDRASIAFLKNKRIGMDESKREWEAFSIEIETLKDKYQMLPIEMFFNLLLNINQMIWDLEADLRQGKLDGALSEVGRRAIEIREHNALRVQVKNIINKITNSGFQDIKLDHISS
jgi:hypothetical protein